MDTQSANLQRHENEFGELAKCSETPTWLTSHITTRNSQLEIAVTVISLRGLQAIMFFCLRKRHTQEGEINYNINSLTPGYTGGYFYNRNLDNKNFNEISAQ